MLVPPASQDAQVINNLFLLLYIFSAFVFLLVEGLLIFSVVRFRRRSANDAPVQIHGNTRLEILWTALPMIVVAIIFVFAMNAMTRLEASGSLSDPLSHVHGINDQAAQRRVEEAKRVDMVVKVTGRQWVWQFNYPDGNFTVNQQLVVPANKTIRLDIVTADVIHSWWVPAFGGMLDVNPGEVSNVWFNAQPGTYTGQCSQFCGLAHAQMLIQVKVLPQAEYDAWYKQQTASSAAPAGAGDAARGKQVFLNGPCVSCHTIEGTVAQGKVAPRPLTHFATYEKIAQVIPNNPDNLTKWLHNPQDVKPGTQMPNLGLKSQDIADLVAFLEAQK